MSTKIKNKNKNHTSAKQKSKKCNFLESCVFTVQNNQTRKTKTTTNKDNIEVYGSNEEELNYWRIKITIFKPQLIKI